MKINYEIKKYIARIEQLETENKIYKREIHAHKQNIKEYKLQVKNLTEQKYILEQKNCRLEEQIRLLLDAKFGKKTEKMPSAPQGQLPLPLVDLTDPCQDTADSLQQKVTPQPRPARKKCGRRHIDPNIPRSLHLIDIPEEDKLCACGASLTRIGQEISEKLDIIPAKVRVIRTVRYKYACRVCQGTEDHRPTVRCAPMPPQLIRHGIVTPSLLAFILTCKFADALPLYRQNNMFKRWGLNIPRSTMSAWILEAAEACKPLLERFSFHLRNSPAINMDETPIQVHKEPGRKNTAKSFMWVACGGVPGRQIVLFSYAPTRSGQEIPRILGNFTGYLQTDGYKGYEAIARHQDITHVGCLAHVRRKFIPVMKAENSDSPGKASKILKLIGHIYHQEKLLQKARKEGRLTLEQFMATRKKKIGVLFTAIQTLMETYRPKIPPSSLLGRALSYALEQWNRIRKYLQCPSLTPDNNVAENALRPFVVGRKNWLFSGSPRGAAASALFYSLIESAKANGLNVETYLCQVFERLPYAKTEDDLESLMPWSTFPDKHPA